ncbi:2OG-Fe(II) oxygenase [Legionella feeleii]|uniref:Predicted proline hydroxylase n=1 Tax=Legionella feeleii TaxID=453 RepID=A0A0W0TH93_9GAMM|nr:2OG-Fe(II) oxygenase [Legionella feeleii]KTC94921.1 hypothetical protein Lfee_2585 [Legionella feeleii]SPX62016.1 Predicted proline hydroxylase [Legionella feeleii]
MINKFISKTVLNQFNKGAISNYLFNDPYPYAVIPNILEDNFFLQARAKCERLIHELTNIEGFEISHTYLNVPELLSVFCSPFFIKLIGKTFDLEVIRKRDQYPSLRVLPEGGNGLHIHNDKEYIGNITVFLYLSDWKEGFGGEVGIYKKSDNHFVKVNQVQPLPNSLLMMPITDTVMYHDINPTAVGYLRKCAYFPISII